MSQRACTSQYRERDSRAYFSTYNDGDVDVGSLLDSLGVGAGVGNDNQARLAERAGDVVGEVTGGEATGNGDSASVGSELEDGTLAVGTGRDDADWSLSDRKPQQLNFELFDRWSGAL